MTLREIAVFFAGQAVGYGSVFGWHFLGGDWMPGAGVAAILAALVALILILRAQRSPEAR